jgi:hypothetical protein
MANRFGVRVLVAILIVAALAGFGYYAYNLGLAQGVAEAGRIAAPSGGGTAPVVVMWRPWGFGFGFFPFFPLVFLFFWLFVARGLFWRGAWRGRGCGYYGRLDGLEEWHQRAHAQQGGEPSGTVSA